MYAPVKTFFADLGFEVKGEVKGCDMVLTKDGALIVIELKTGINLKLIFQALERQKITNQVYIAVPRMKNTRSKLYRNTLALVQKLELGLLTVAMDSPVKTVEIINFPPLASYINSRKSGPILKEARGRTFDLNKGGSSGKKLLTAYREKVIKIACALEFLDESSAPAMIEKYDCDKYTNSILNFNPYGWFIKVRRGVFSLSEKGKIALSSGEFEEVVAYYRDYIANY